MSTIRNNMAISAIAVSLLSLAVIRPAAATGFEKPVITNAYSNAPAMITLAWNHSGEAPAGDNFYGFILQQQSPYGNAGREIPSNYRVWTVPLLTPNTTYRYRLCAVYDYNTVCSDEGGTGYVSVTTMPPEAPHANKPPSSPPLPAPPARPQPLTHPVIRAQLVPVFPSRPDSPYQARITWVNPVQRAMYDHVAWFRDGAVLGLDIFVTQYDDPTRNPGALSRYKLCVENAVSRACSNEVVIAPVQQMPPGNLQSRPLPSKGAIPSTASTCSPGYVWREARPNDLVCVTPGSRVRVAEENRTAATRVQPGGGAYGPNTCRGGYVWREAFSGDLVCVNPEIRTLVAQENQLASSRLAALVVPQTPPGNLQPGPLRSKGALPRL